MIHNAVIKCRKRPGLSGYMYDVFLDNEFLLSSRDPEFSSCRALVDRGLKGELRVWREGGSTWDIRIPDIEEGAKISVLENREEGPRFTKYRPFDIEKLKQGSNPTHRIDSEACH